MRPVRVVMPTPAFNLAPRVKQIAEPAYLQTLFTQTAVEALDVGVLDRLARPDVHQFDPLILTPAQEAAAGELRAVVPAEWNWPAADTLETPERRIRQRRDATGAPTQRPESLGTATAVPELP